MHIGTARTALFNLLYARHCGGTFLLRIEDTDRERSTEANVQIILDGLAWLGLEPDAPPVFQAARAARHVEVVQAMLERGGAYRDWTTSEELEAERELARAEGRVVRSVWRDRNEPGPEGQPFAVRLKAPQTGETVVADLIKGDVVFRNAELDDLVLLRSDGTPTYNLAVVVDDHDMGITHVIRGDDHLSNAARQTLIYQAMDWELPAFGHLPLIHGPDGAKLSKRHGAQAVGEFADMGYLPEGLRNYLARLGWGHGDDEIFSDAEAAAWFDVKDVVKAPARLDWPKLNHINQHYIREADDARLADLVAEVYAKRVRCAACRSARRAYRRDRPGEGRRADLAATGRPDPVRHQAPGPSISTRKLENSSREETIARLSRLTAKLGAETAWSKTELRTVDPRLRRIRRGRHRQIRPCAAAAFAFSRGAPAHRTWRAPFWPAGKSRGAGPLGRGAFATAIKRYKARRNFALTAITRPYWRRKGEGSTMENKVAPNGSATVRIGDKDVDASGPQGLDRT